MNRREFLMRAGTVVPSLLGGAMTMNQALGTNSQRDGEPIKLFLGGDLMTGRGIDQILPTPSDPRLFESYVTTATTYLDLAEAVNGPIPRPVDVAYPWGDALSEIAQAAPDARIVNLETAITRSDNVWAQKSVNYRMHPANIGCLTAAAIDCCVLANNHSLDWGYQGLDETLAILRGVGVRSAGAGRDIVAAAAPAVLNIAGKGRVLVFAFGSPTSGIPPSWAATKSRAGVNLLDELSAQAVDEVSRAIQSVRRPRDIVVASIHWGGNWGYDIADEYRDFAHRLIDDAGVDLIHGHSSHHAKGIEVYRGRPILYGCGDLLNDYEGIRGYEAFRDDLVLMYFASMNPSSQRLVKLEMTPLQIRKFRLNYPSAADLKWLHDRLNHECARFGHRLELRESAPRTLRLIEALAAPSAQG
jgi:poly-gamma-glutamate synthesis protein (capsule biosynthesis protein)